jgi:endonuclease YncB( thermonuclease family)
VLGTDIHMLFLFFRTVAVGVLVLLAGASAIAEVMGRATVIDGDTIEIAGQRIRLHGIDAPEKGQPCFGADNRPYRCGPVAANALDEFIGQSPVNCHERSTDRYGRLVADCSVRGQDIEEWLVRNGFAMAYRRYSTDYIGAEQEAKNNRRGVWAGTMQPPWEWRKEQRAQ